MKDKLEEPMKTNYILMTITAGIMFLCAGLTACKEKTPPRTVTEEQNDQKLAEAVKAAFEKSPAFKFPDVQVVAFNGNVQLSGFVLVDEQKSSAESIAKGVSGVVEVENSIELKH
jgi:hyperosmotically inducible protein